MSTAKKMIDWSSQPLGQVTDGELARRLGVTRSTVQAARNSRGIPPLQERHRYRDSVVPSWSRHTYATVEAETPEEYRAWRARGQRRTEAAWERLRADREEIAG